MNRAPALGVLSLNYWTSREVLWGLFSVYACWLFGQHVLGVLLMQGVCRCGGRCQVVGFSVAVVAPLQPRSFVMGVEAARGGWGRAAASDHSRSQSLSRHPHPHAGRKAVMVGPPLPVRPPQWCLWEAQASSSEPIGCGHTRLQPPWPCPLPRPALGSAEPWH